jgi:hypothetical protein
MEIAFDEDKIEREGKYDVNKMWAEIDKFMLQKYKLKKTAPGIYADYPGYCGCGIFMGFGIRFENYPWFTKNLSKWYLYACETGDPNIVSREDWKLEIAEKGLA